MFFHAVASQHFPPFGGAPELTDRLGLDSIPATAVDVQLCNLIRKYLVPDDQMFAVGGDRVARFANAYLLGFPGSEIGHFHDAVANASRAGDPFPASRVQQWRKSVGGLIALMPPRDESEAILYQEFAAFADTVAQRAREAAGSERVPDVDPLLPRLMDIEMVLQELPSVETVEQVVHGLTALLTYADTPAAGRPSQDGCAAQLMQVHLSLHQARKVVAYGMQTPHAGLGHAKLFNLLDRCACLADIAERRLDPQCEFPFFCRAMLPSILIFIQRDPDPA